MMAEVVTQLKQIFYYRKYESNRKLILVLVAVAIFLDNMLLTTIVPIVPDYLYKKRLEKFNNSISSSVNATDVKEGSDKHDILREENLEVGILFASKASIQFLVNPLVGILIDRIGYSLPMFSGLIIMFISTLTFAFGESYNILIVARSVQGIGSSLSSVSGMGMVADVYPNDEERGRAMGIALGGLAFGVLAGPPFGGLLYNWFNKETPFVILAILSLFNSVFQLAILSLEIKSREERKVSIKHLLKDPYILITGSVIMSGNIGIAMLEPSLPIWMMDNLNSPKWELGVVLLPSSISYLICSTIFGKLAYNLGRWKCAMAGMFAISICLVWITFSTSLSTLLLPCCTLGFAIGMVDSSMMPTMGYLVDIRHNTMYGSVYALADVAFCLAYAIGPSLGGFIIKKIGFFKMLYLIAALNFFYAPILLFLRNPPQIYTPEQININTQNEYNRFYSEEDINSLKNFCEE